MITVIETPLFTRKVVDILTEEQRDGIAVQLATDPYIGSVVPGTGGVRKLRVRAKNKGKSGGARVIYYNLLMSSELYLLTIYDKSETENLSNHELAQIRRELTYD